MKAIYKNNACVDGTNFDRYYARDNCAKFMSAILNEIDEGPCSFVFVMAL